MNIRIPLRFRHHDDMVVTQDSSSDPAANLGARVQTFRSIPFEGLIADTSKFPRLRDGEIRFPKRLPTPRVPPSNVPDIDHD